jgi:hypothetical protein
VSSCTFPGKETERSVSRVLKLSVRHDG